MWDHNKKYILFFKKNMKNDKMLNLKEGRGVIYIHGVEKTTKIQLLGPVILLIIMIINFKRVHMSLFEKL